MCNHSFGTKLENPNKHLNVKNNIDPEAVQEELEWQNITIYVHDPQDHKKWHELCVHHRG